MVSIFDFAGNPFPQNVVSCCTEMNFLNHLSAINMTVTSKSGIPLCSCCSCPCSDNCHCGVAVPWGPTAEGAGGHGAGSALWALTCFLGGISQKVTAVLVEIGCGVSRGVGISSTGQQRGCPSASTLGWSRGHRAIAQAHTEDALPAAGFLCTTKL